MDLTLLSLNIKVLEFEFSLPQSSTLPFSLLFSFLFFKLSSPFFSRLNAFFSHVVLSINMVLNVHRNHKAYHGRGEWGEGGDNTPVVTLLPPECASEEKARRTKADFEPRSLSLPACVTPYR